MSIRVDELTGNCNIWCRKGELTPERTQQVLVQLRDRFTESEGLDEYNWGDLLKACRSISRQIITLNAEQQAACKELASACYQRVFTYEFERESLLPQRAWYNSSVYPFARFLPSETYARCAKRIFDRVLSEGCRFDKKHLLEGRASEEELREIAHYLIERDMGRVLHFFTHFGQNVELAKICGEKNAVFAFAWIEEFNLNPQKHLLIFREMFKSHFQQCGFIAPSDLDKCGFVRYAPEYRAFVVGLVKLSEKPILDYLNLDPENPKDQQIWIEIGLARFDHFDDVRPEGLDLVPGKPAHLPINLELARRDLAGASGDFDIYRILKKWGVQNDSSFRYHSLYGAVLRNDLHAVKWLLEKDKKDPKVRDDLGFTPLHYAAMRNQPGIIHALMEAGADIEAAGGVSCLYLLNMVPSEFGGKLMRVKRHMLEQSTPTILAAWYGHKEALAELLKYSPNCHVQNGYGFSAEFGDRANRLGLIPPSQLTKEIYLAKLLAHACAATNAGDSSSRFPLEGGMAQGMYYEIGESLEEFHKLFFSKGQFAGHGHMGAEVEEAFKQAHIRHSAKDLSQRIQNGKITIIPTGSHGHYTSLVFGEERVLACDGNCRDPILSFQYLPRFLTESAFQDFIDKRVEVADFDLGESEMLKRIKIYNKTTVDLLKTQSVGNCSFFSALAALISTAWLTAKSWGIENHHGFAATYKRDFETYFRLKIMRRYLEVFSPQNHPVTPHDEDLIEWSFAKISKDVRFRPSDLAAYFNQQVKELCSKR